MVDAPFDEGNDDGFEAFDARGRRCQRQGAVVGGPGHADFASRPWGLDDFVAVVLDLEVGAVVGLALVAAREPRLVLPLDGLDLCGNQNVQDTFNMVDSCRMWREGSARPRDLA